MTAHAVVRQVVPAGGDETFDLVHDYPRRLTWDTLLREAYTVDHAPPAKGVEAVCTARRRLGGLSFRTWYVHVALLAGLPHPVTLDVDGFGPVLFCHGTPRDDEEVVLVDSRLQRWAEVFADLPPEVRTVVCGHTHMPFVRLVDRRLVVNPGSIGMPYGRPGGTWALLHAGAVTLHHTPIDVDAAVARIVAESDYPGGQEWADHHVRAAASDTDALTAFGPRDGR